MAYTIKPSAGMLPIEDMSNIMKAKGFLTEVSPDNIEKVTRRIIKNGAIETTLPGIFEPYNIALCTGKVINGNIDRETVKNSLRLNGREAKDYLVIEDKENLVDRNKSLSKIYSDEIQLLRDELYHLKTELIKNGHLEDTNVAKGFIDNFKNSKLRYDKNTTTIAEINGEAIKQSQNIFNQDDWIALRKNVNDVNEISIDTVISESGNDIVLENGAVSLSIANSLLTKSLGEYKSGTFSFSKTDTNALGTRERYTVLNDDLDLKEKTIVKTNTGFATIIRIPSRHTGFLTKFIAQGRKIGSPGALTCYVIKGNSQTIENMATTNSITERIVENTCFAKSAPVSIVDPIYKEITFDFAKSEFDIIASNSTLYPEVIGGNEYCFIVESSYASEEDYWIIEFGMNNNTDLQTNNKSYIFNRDTVESTSKEIEPLEDDRDMFYTVVTREIEEESEIPYKHGLYTSANTIKLSNPIKACRARLTLEINKEGNFMSISKGLKRKNIDKIDFAHASTNLSAEQTVICGGDNVVIGNEITKVISSTPSSLWVDKTIYVDEKVPIYRVGYEAQIKVRYVETDPITFLPTVRYGSEKVYPLKLVAMIPNGRGIESSCSDRLIFETDLLDYETLQAYADKCDVNNDGVVTAADVELISSYTSNNTPEIIEKYDINDDGIIDIFDAVLASKYINHKVGTPLTDELEFNEAVLQIKWKGNLDSTASRLQLKKGNDYVGRIRSLSLIFDKIM